MRRRSEGAGLFPSIVEGGAGGFGFNVHFVALFVLHSTPRAAPPFLCPDKKSAAGKCRDGRRMDEMGVVLDPIYWIGPDVPGNFHVPPELS